MHFLAVGRPYGKPSPRRHLKTQQIQGRLISNLCILKSFDKRTDHDRLRPSQIEKAKAECPAARSARRCTCESARTLRRWKIKSASFAKSPSGGAGMGGKATKKRESLAPRDETDGPASTPCSRTPTGGSSISSWPGRLTAWAAH